MRGLPWRVTEDEITDFFKDFKFVEKSIQLGHNEDGRRNGWGCILFKDEDEAASATDKLQKQYIGERFICLYQMNYGQYQRFNSTPGNSGGSRGSSSNDRPDVKLSNHVTPENQEKCLVCRGLPFRVTDEEMIEFFKDI